MSTPRGKIGRLSDEVRQRLNPMLRDNLPAVDIITYLDANGFPGITPQNISSWKRFGYEKWLRRMERLEDMAQTRDWAAQVVARNRAEGNSASSLASDAASLLAVDSIAHALEEFQPDALGSMLAEKPEKFMDLVDSLSRIRGRDQAAVILQQKVDDYKRRLRELVGVVEQKGDATKEDIQAVFQEAYGLQ
jgi:hypothetical protein